MTDPYDILHDALSAHVDIHGRTDVLPVSDGSTAAVMSADQAPGPVERLPSVAAPPATPIASRPQADSASRLSASVGSASPETAFERIVGLIPADSPLAPMTTLEEVEGYVRDSILIDLDKTRLNPVFGVGRPDADLLVIGEAPGADEDRQGEPFVGRAGQLLTLILGAIGFERKDVYIANILKSRPPNNRDPQPEEIRAHLPILHKQIALIQPKLILCVGRTAGTSLLGRDATLKSMRGVFHNYHGLEVMVTYHPAALLRNPQWKRPTWDDVQLLRTRYNELVGA